MRALSIAAVGVGLLTLTGCHSAYMEATVHNGTGAPITLLEVDYPSASFGKESLPTDADFNYRFKILGNGSTKVLWTDAERHEHSVAGPSLTEGQEGSVRITLSGTSAAWQLSLLPKH